MLQLKINGSLIKRVDSLKRFWIDISCQLKFYKDIQYSIDIQYIIFQDYAKT